MGNKKRSREDTRRVSTKSLFNNPYFRERARDLALGLGRASGLQLDCKISISPCKKNSRLSPIEFAVQNAVKDITAFHTYLDIVRGIPSYHITPIKYKITAYKKMKEIRETYPGNLSLVNKMDEAEKYLNHYLKLK